MTDEIANLPPLREIIAEHGLQTRKSLGQNFLLDLNITQKIARLAGDLTHHDVLEIGAGPGGLTRALLMAGARRVLAVERDGRCLPALYQIAQISNNRLDIIADDALAFDAEPVLNHPVKIVANLPYNIGTALLVRWLTADWPPFWDSLTLMFQKEVAARLVAGVGDKSYGRLSLLAQWRCDVQVVMDLPARAFTPAPKVDSALVHITALDAPRFAADSLVLQKVTAHAFQQRRKMLRGALKPLHRDIEQILVECGIDPSQRGETVDLEGFCAVARSLVVND